MSLQTGAPAPRRRQGGRARIRASTNSGAWAALTAVLAVLAACPPSDYWIGGDDEGATGSPTPADLGSAPCSNGQLDPGETDVDCGPACGPCDPDPVCDEDGACSSGVCIDGVCAPDLCADVRECPPTEDPCLMIGCDPAFGCFKEIAAPGTPCETPWGMSGVCKEGACVDACGSCSHLDGPCRVGVCEILSGECAVKWPIEGGECFTDTCMHPGICVEGLCVPHDGTVIFSSDFSDPGLWLTEGLWEIGPAVSSMCGGIIEDPAADHTPSADEMLAGLVIGGCLPPDPAPSSCLTSPLVEVPIPAAGLRLRYWEVQELPPEPEVMVMIEVFDGFDWWIADVSAGEPAPMWTPREVPLGEIKGPLLQVRLCVTPMAGMLATSGWSVDDVEVVVDGC